MTSQPAEAPHRRRALIIPAPAAGALALAAVPVTWWAVGTVGGGRPDHDLGPFHVPLGLLYALGGLGVALAVASLVAMAIASRNRRSHAGGLSPRAMLLSVAAGGLVAAGGRIATAGSDGANIGGDGVMVLGPIVIAGLLLAAVHAQHRYRPMSVGRASAAFTLAGLVAPALWATVSTADAYADSRGVTTQAAYDKIAVGDSRVQVRQRLGEPSDEATDWFFGAPPTAASCDYYETSGSTSRVFRLCYRAGVLVAKQASDGPH